MPGGFEYVADGASGLRVIDVSSPSAPFEVGTYETAWWPEPAVVLSDGDVFVTGGDAGLCVFAKYDVVSFFHGFESGDISTWPPKVP